MNTQSILSTNTDEGKAARVAYIDERSVPLMELMVYLYGRWQDEKEYEDFNEYIKLVTAKALECFPQATDITFNKTFKLGMILPDFHRVVFYVNSKTAGWKGTGLTKS